jgi:Tfp pilus assembly protein PilO
MSAWVADLRTSARHPAARFGIFFLLLSILILGASAAYWWPAEAARSRVEEETAQKRRALAQVRQAREVLDAYKAAATEVAVLEKKLDHAATQAQLVQNFSRLAKSRGVKIVGETYDDGRSGGAQGALSAELAVQGGYPALRNFLADLSGLPTWSEVQEVRLESLQGAPEQKGRVRIVTYRNARPGSAM